LRKPCLLLPVALLMALALSACGGGESAEDKIAGTIETAATSTDPANCQKLMTLKFVEQTTQSEGKEAEKQCEREAESGENNPEVVNVGSVVVKGDAATANVEFEGGGFNGQTLTVALTEAEGDWKLDEITGFAKFDAAKLIATLRESLEEEESIEPPVIACIVAGVGKWSQGEFERLIIEGNSAPIVKLAESCEKS
jgi:hypothetical protein